MEKIMTQEEKELLLKDLCGRLPYGVLLDVDNGKYREDKKIWPGSFNSDSLWDAKPYLRPMSSMTEEESIELSMLSNDKFKFYLYSKENIIVSLKDYHYLDSLHILDWLNSHHFDYRGLIEKGLALEAKEENLINKK